MNIDQFKQKMSEKFSDEKYSIIYAGKNSHDYSKIKCLNCGKIIVVNTGELLRKRRKHICKDCYYLREDTKKNREIIRQKLEKIGDNIEFFMKKQSKNGNKGDVVRFTCRKCNRINEIFVGNLIRHKSNCLCCYCSGVKNKKDAQAFQYELENNYPNCFEILSDYINTETDMKIKCKKCGFIRNVKPRNLLRSGYCPKCNYRTSKGERYIAKWLKEHNISFEQQKYFQKWNIGIHYFDFFIPQYNLVIEFHGVQHYEYNSFFHKTQDEFIYRIERDKIKRDAAIKNGVNYLSIKYTLYNEIDEIFSRIFGSTTISKESKGKFLEMESFHTEEDIVWT